MSNLNLKAKAEHTYDAIVVGTGVSGGWAAKELTEKGLKTLVLDRGRDVKHIEDYPTMHKDPWDFKYQGKQSNEKIKRQEKQNRTGYTTNEAHAHFFVDDIDNPYNEEKRFDWMRGYQVGGRSLVWGRHSYRLSQMDFEANLKDGIAIDWPIRYEDMAPWYDYVERHIGVSGQNEGYAQLPDGQFLPAMEMNCVEKVAKEAIEANFKGRNMTMGRVAHVTGPLKGRSQCQFRNRCMRGCPFGAYFSSQSSTLPVAESTGNMTLRPNSIVASVIYDDETQRATGVRVIDKETKEEFEYYAKIIFLNASAVASTQILMQSTSDRFENGLGNDSGELGHNLMDHVMGGGASASVEGFEDKYYKGRRPGGFYIPRFRNISEESKTNDFIRGYGYQGRASRSNWQSGVAEFKYGATFKEDNFKPGSWQIGMGGFGECLPYHDNKMALDHNKVDQWGLPTVTFDCEFKENEKAICNDMANSAVEMLETAGFKDVKMRNEITAPGLSIHEMGTARMGRDSKTSVLNANCQVHAVKNVFVTDGAAMTSAGCQNPSLTYMALTARAANFAVDEIKKKNL